MELKCLCEDKPCVWMPASMKDDVVVEGFWLGKDGKRIKEGYVCECGCKLGKGWLRVTTTGGFKNG